MSDKHIGIICAMKEEIGKTLDKLTNISKRKFGDLEIFSGLWKSNSFNKLYVSIAFSGWGKVSAARTTTRMLSTDFNLKPIDIKKVFYHGPCQLKSHAMGLPALEIMRLIPELKIVLSEADCCGIGGTYGYGKEKSYISNSIKINLVEQVKNEKPDLIICDSETCRWNIEKSSKIKTIHPIQLILTSLKNINS